MRQVIGAALAVMGAVMGAGMLAGSAQAIGTPAGQVWHLMVPAPAGGVVTISFDPAAPDSLSGTGQMGRDETGYSAITWQRSGQALTFTYEEYGTQTHCDFWPWVEVGDTATNPCWLQGASPLEWQERYYLTRVH